MKHPLRHILFFLIAVMLCTMPPAVIAQNETLPPDLAVDDDLLQQKLREVSRTLRCAVCQSETIWESNATLAIQMRDIVLERLTAGESPDEIRAYFVSRYGDYIVFKPRFRGINLLLWGGPFILLAIGGFILVRNLRRWTTPSNKAQTESSDEILDPIDDKQRKRIEDELRSLR